MDPERETPEIASPPPKRLGSNLLLTWTLFACAAFIPMGLIGLWFHAHQPANETRTTEAVVSISPASGFNEILEKLQTSGIIRHKFLFRILADILGITKHLKAGEYRFSVGQTPYEILKKLARGEVILRAITIPEGLTLSQIADRLAQGAWVDRKLFFEKLKDPSLATSLGLGQKTFEGYLFPDTYHISKGLDETAIIRMMTDRMVLVLTDLYELPEKSARPDFSKFPSIKRRGVDLTLHEVLTLASIVEKETALAKERPMIAAVFLNRLRRGMRLQTDPTVIYGLPFFNGNLTRKDLRTLTPYNTYRIKGLPPGPIANPGRAAIEAVLLTKKQFSKKYPSLDWQALDKYVYFVSKNDGSHIFSNTLAEHNRAVNKYQKGK